MPDIIDVSPTRANTNASDIGHSVTGRMLAIGCSEDGRELYAGSYGNMWNSTDGGNNWAQLGWAQPAPGQFDVPGALGGMCVSDIAVKLGWRVEKHPRFLARLRRNIFRHRSPMDIVGFGDSGVWTALGHGDGSFQEPNVVLGAFGYLAGGWQVDKHPRFVVDLTGDGIADLIGFGDDGVWIAIGNGDGTFKPPQFVLENFGVNQGWRVDQHPRFVMALTKSGYADIIGFGDDGVWTALGNGDGSFQDPKLVLPGFCVSQGWRVDKHPRTLADLASLGKPGIVGFGDAGVWTALGKGDGTFEDARFVLANFGVQQGWHVDKHPRIVANLADRSHVDIVGFGDAGVYTALGDGHGGFVSFQFALANFGVEQGWQVDKHPRFVANLTNSGHADIVGFGDAGVWTALGDGHGGFPTSNFVLENLGVEQGWQVDRHPRFVAPLTNSNHADILGFGDAGVWTALGDGQGGFPTSNCVLDNFGYGTIVLALMAADRASGSRGIWRSTDWGNTWKQVHMYGNVLNVGQLLWADGSDHLVYAAGGNSLAISKDAGATFQDVYPFGWQGKSVNHVAVWQNAPSDPWPAIIYALGDSAMALSFDGGNSWMQDQGTVPPLVGGGVGLAGNSTTPKVLIISPRWPLEVYAVQDGSGGATPVALYRGDYSQFPFGDQTSSWESVVLPNALVDTSEQDAGNEFLLGTRKGQGDLLFIGGQRYYNDSLQAAAYVGPLYPQSSSDWHRLDVVHVDLHGFLLSPDFHATIQSGNYQHGGGQVWILSDGGIYRSSNGGDNFNPATRAMTLSSMSVAGVSLPGQGPALSLNQGDNDGFYSMDGGQHWSYQQYGGGDNDCAYADPQRPHAIMVFTPRWDTAGNNTATRFGQTVAVYQTKVGHLPDGRAGTHDRKAVTGPPTLSPTDPSREVWNANSFYGQRGFRPIVLGLSGETAPAQGDYIFILDPQHNPVLVRTQNIFDIKHRDEWITTATGPGQGANVFLQGPPLPSPNLGLVQASGGHGATVYYVGGDNTLWTLTPGAGNWQQIVPAQPIAGRSVGANSAIRFFASPYDTNVVYILDSDHVKRSDDGGQTWNVDQNLETQLTWNGAIPVGAPEDTLGLGEHFDLILTDMQFDPNNLNVRFAIGTGGAFLSTDKVTWSQILHTSAQQGRPSSCYYDANSEATQSLYVSFGGRSVVKIAGLQVYTIF